MNVKFNSRDPVYLQVVQHFKQQIAKGTYVAGQEIPSRRELAQQFQINPNTVQRAYKEMEEQQLIYTDGNLPSCITKDEHVLHNVRHELIQEAVQTFIQSVKSINAPLPEVVALIEQHYEEEDSHD
ncbi:MAG: GntR family transcriptional regulator [Caryophanon sp.]|nr:GntR family transcriptional regulator [Caryophanon sp.]